MVLSAVREPVFTTPEGLFLSLSAQYAAVKQNLVPLAEALKAPTDAVGGMDIVGSLGEITDDLYQEMLSVSGGLYESLSMRELKSNFLAKTWIAYASTIGRLLYMNGVRGLGINDLVGGDDYTTSLEEIDDLVQYKHAFPNAFRSCEILSLEQGMREVFHQWYGGADSEELAKMLDAYYRAFQFDEKTTTAYTNQSELKMVGVDNLKHLLSHEYIPLGARIAIFGPGPNPPELDVIRALQSQGLLMGVRIDGYDMQTTEALGISEEQTKEWATNDNYHFHGGQRLDGVDDAYDMVFSFGSSFYNDPNYFHQFRDIFKMAQLIKPGGLLVYDAASLEASPAHLEAFHKLHNVNPATPIGVRQSAHFKDFLARILPHHLLETYTGLGGVSIITEDVWSMARDKSRTMLIGRKHEVPNTSFGNLVENLISRAYRVPPSGRRP